METVNFGGWPGCVRIANDEIEAIVTADVGPRVVRLGRPGGANAFREFPEMQGLTGGDEWRVLGGHRLWHAPEQKPRCYQPDNEPVQVKPLDRGAQFIQNVEAGTGIRKSLTLEALQGSHIRAVHTLTNEGLWPVRLAPWALTIVAPGGRAILPQPPMQGSDNLLPNRTLVLWPYTRLDDPRLEWGERYLRVRMDPSITPPTKVGTQVLSRWCAYAKEGSLFLKVVAYQPSAVHPDFNCSVEVYTAGDFLELETLGALVELNPGEETSHVEHWFLFEDPAIDAASEEQIDATILPLVQDALRGL